MNRADSPHYAGFWRRLLAAIIDTVIFTLLMALIFGPVAMNAGMFTPLGVLQTVVGMLLTVILWIKFLGTPGKLLLGCQVVDADSFQPLTLRQSILRYVAYLASMLPLLLGFLWIAFDARKQGFHDKIAHSVVLYNAGIEAKDESQKSLLQLLSELR